MCPSSRDAGVAREPAHADERYTQTGRAPTPVGVAEAASEGCARPRSCVSAEDVVELTIAPALQRAAGLGSRRLRLWPGRGPCSAVPRASASTGRRRSAAGSARRDGDGVTVWSTASPSSRPARRPRSSSPCRRRVDVRRGGGGRARGTRASGITRSPVLRVRPRARGRGRSPDLPGAGGRARPGGGAVGPGCLARSTARHRAAGVPLGCARLSEWLGAHRRGRWGAHALGELAAQAARARSGQGSAAWSSAGRSEARGGRARRRGAASATTARRARWRSATWITIARR